LLQGGVDAIVMTLKTTRVLPMSRVAHHLLAIYLLIAGFLLPAHVWAADPVGSLDSGFTGAGLDGSATIGKAVVQPDGKILIVGTFVTYGGISRNRIARLNSDGSLDTSFDVGSGANAKVSGIALQTDGRVLITGDFTSYNGTARKFIARLLNNGSLDSTFDPGSSTDVAISDITVQADGKILLVGSFNAYNNIGSSRIVRLNGNGSFDSNFRIGLGANDPVNTVAVQPDGKILIGGDFASFNGVPKNRTARLNPDGSVDTDFAGSAANSYVSKLVLLPNGKILVSGNFTSLGGISRRYIARLNSNGSVDSGFFPASSSNAEISVITLQADGKILVGGGFNFFVGVSRPGIARINADGTVDGAFNPAGVNGGFIAVSASGRLLMRGTGGIVSVHAGDTDDDGFEDAADYFSNNSAAAVDADRDDMPDAWLQPNAFGCSPEYPACNGLTLDTDKDGDGISDSLDNCPAAYDVNQFDADHDGTGDLCDPDADNDAIANGSDAFPLDVSASQDADSDGAPESWNSGCDINCHAQSVLALDNCPSNFNFDQADDDHDGIGNACESDGPGKLDVGFVSGADAAVKTIAFQPDGKIVIGGNFSFCAGVGRKYIARLNADGTVDSGFNPGTGFNGSVNAVFVQSDGAVLVGGNFTSYNGTTRNYLARIGTDGLLDPGFNSGVGPSGSVTAIAIQTDGKIIVAGIFTAYNGVARNYIARLNMDGSLDSGFVPGSGVGAVKAMALQPDGKIVIGGTSIARLNADGGADTAFIPGSGTGGGQVNAVVLQSDGRIIIGGTFSLYSGMTRKNLARLNADGTLDPYFSQGSGPASSVNAILVQPDGNIVVVGNFMSYSGVARNNVFRLTSNGLIDANFNIGSGLTSQALTLAVGNGGRILLAGNFSSYNTTSLSGLVLIHSGDADNDSVEDAGDRFPNNPIAAIDVDRDGLPDAWIHPEGFGCLATDAVCNGLTLDADYDNDGFTNLSDNCPIVANTDQLDRDGDGIGNVCDPDMDNDGVVNYADKFPLDPAEWADIDNDGIGDNVDTDNDNDGAIDTVDNCLMYANADQADDDHDGVGNPCDSDGPGKIDVTFNAGSGPDSSSFVVAVQADGKLLLSGNFTTFNTRQKNRIVRLNADGNIDPGFHAGASAGFDNTVTALYAMADGKIMAGGYFSLYRGVARNRIARLNEDGSLDSGFNPGSGPNSYPYVFAGQADGKIIVGGSFTSYAGSARNYIARLNSDGSLDSTFSPGSGASALVSGVVVQPDGKVVIAGDFTSYGGVTRKYIARLNQNGSLDTGFLYASGFNGSVKSLALQADGKIIASGDFTSYDGIARNKIARLNSDGSLDAGFDPGLGANNQIAAIVLQADGRVIAGGSFTAYAGVTRNRIARLNADGSLDTGFNPVGGASANISSLTVQADGRLVLGGVFTSYNGTQANYLTRIHTGDADGDGVENAADYFSSNAVAAEDRDRDGLPDAWLQPNTLGCLPDDAACNGLAIDGDRDGDGFSNATDNCPSTANADQQNFDGDVSGDACDSDIDGDGFFNAADIFPINAAEWLDSDNDGIGDNSETDDDDDGLLDDQDNCPVIVNADQADEDHNGVGNLCDNNAAGRPDAGFIAARNFDDSVLAMAIQADKKVIVGGNFSVYAGASRNFIARLNADGSLDAGFNPGAGFNGKVFAIAVQSDGKILVGGEFSGYNGISRKYLVRLFSDGSIDTAFNQGVGFAVGMFAGGVNAIVIQPDGKILVGGGFVSYGGVSRAHIARLNPDGTLDSGFNVGNGTDDFVYTIVLQPDGKIVIGGSFTTYSGVSRKRIARINSDGSPDASFNISGGGANSNVLALALQSGTGKIVIGGYFTSYNNNTRNYIAILNADGSLDSGFSLVSGANAYVSTVILQGDGKIIAGGGFTTFNSVSRKYFVRVSQDGSIDNNFYTNAGPDNLVLATAVQSDGQLLLSGSFLNYGGIPAEYITRIHTGDVDRDGVENAADQDSDNDGVIDALDKFPLDAAEWADNDGDAIGDNADLDDDNDLVLDVADNCRFNANADQLDTDLDGIGNACDPDIDNDGVPNASDKFPLDISEWADMDNDGLGDNADTDNDNDGVADVSDNCWLILNPDQLDDDNDGIGNACDSDGPGKLDASFQSAAASSFGISALALQPDGKIIVGGTFASYGGAARNNIVRLNMDGSLDAGFIPGTGANSSVYTVAVQGDGKIVIGGFFTSYNGVSRGHIARLNTDGSLDASFNPGSGANYEVYALAIQPDGKIVIGGFYTLFNGVSRNYIARLNVDGSLDVGFNSGTGFNGFVQALSIQADGKIIAGGFFSMFNGFPAGKIARLNADGTLDASFNSASGFNGVINALALQGDGKVIAGGAFGSYSGITRNYIARLRNDGSIDAGFDPGVTVKSQVRAVASQADGKVLVVSDNASPVNQLVRLNANGSVDTSFNAGNAFNASVIRMAFALQADGKLLAGDGFNSYNGTTIKSIVRIHTGDVDQDGFEDAADYFTTNPVAAMDSDKDGLPDVWIQPNIFGCAVAATFCNGLMLDIDNDNDSIPDYIDADPLNAAIHTEKLLLLNGTYRGSSVKESVTIQ
jgi:uncharacterized delta-60 repeat protein